MPFVCDGVKVKFIIFVLILKKKYFGRGDMKIHHICFQPKIFCHYIDDFDHICIQPKIFCHHRYVDDFMIAKMLWLIPAMFEMSSV